MPKNLDDTWSCPKEGCDLPAEAHNLAMAINHIYEDAPTVSGRNFDMEESTEVANRILDRLCP
jgi:hypothetical protein